MLCGFSSHTRTLTSLCSIAGFLDLGLRWAKNSSPWQRKGLVGPGLSSCTGLSRCT